MVGEIGGRAGRAEREEDRVVAADGAEEAVDGRRVDRTGDRLGGRGRSGNCIRGVDVVLTGNANQSK